MRHAWYRRRFSRALDGDLTPRGQQRLQEHLAHCAGCRKAFAELRGTVRLLHDVAAVKPPAMDMSAQIMARISAAPTPWYRRLAPPAPALLPALGGALALAVVALWPLPGGDQRAPGPAGRAGNSAPAAQTAAAPSPEVATQVAAAAPSPRLAASSPDVAAPLAERSTPAAQAAPSADVEAQLAPAVPAPPRSAAPAQRFAESSPEVATQVAAAAPAPDVADRRPGGAPERAEAKPVVAPTVARLESGAEPSPAAPSPDLPAALAFRSGAADEAEGASSGPAPAAGPLPKPLSPAFVRPVTTGATGAPGRRARPGPPMTLGFAEGAAPNFGREPAGLHPRVKQQWLETALQQPLALVESLQRIPGAARRERVIEGLARFAAERGVSQQLAEKLRATEDTRALELAERFETRGEAPGEAPEGTSPATP